VSTCTFDPGPLVGVPLGMFHCPECGCMVIAGLAHGPCEDGCDKQDDRDRASWDRGREEPT
jgi:hypothetical protein